MAKLVWREVKTKKKPAKKAAVRKKSVFKKAKKIIKASKKTSAKAKTSKKKVIKKAKKILRSNTLNKSAKKTATTKARPNKISILTTDIEKIVAQVSAGQPEESLVEGAKFDIGVVHNAHALVTQDIPHEYGKNHVMLLVVDPRFAFTYWEISKEAMHEAANQLGSHAKLTLRFYDITRSMNPDESNFWDVEVFDRLGNWYLRLEYPEQRLCLDVGMKNAAGEFCRLARSNVMRLPPQSLAHPGPIKWMVVTPSGEKLISDVEEYTDADLNLLKKILGPYFYDLLMRGRFASLSGSSIEAIFFDVSSLKIGESPSGKPPWGN